MSSWCDGADVSVADTAAVAAAGLGVSERVTSCVIYRLSLLLDQREYSPTLRMRIARSM